MINSNCSEVGGCDAAAAQYQWVAQELAQNPRQCIAAVWHHPRFASGGYGNDRSTQEIWDLLERAGADVVLSGHEHFYERLSRANASGDPSATGMRQFIVGTGGAALYPFGSTISPLSQVRSSQTHGLLRIDLSSTGYSWNFAPIVGGTFTDSGSDSC